MLVEVFLKLGINIFLKYKFNKICIFFDISIYIYIFIIKSIELCLFLYLLICCILDNLFKNSSK